MMTELMIVLSVLALGGITTILLAINSYRFDIQRTHFLTCHRDYS